MLNEVFDKEAFEKSKEEIKELCNRFDNRKEEYLQKNYKEASVRKEFIDYMFKALGWDVDNTQGFSRIFQEVVVEETIEVEGKGKNPDYTFQIGGNKIFFLEAKAPHVDIKNDRNPAYQVRRYGWSAKLDICILTDFEQFSVYETNNKPKPTQSAHTGRVKYYEYTDYVDKWEEIYSIFSKEAVMKGFFDDFAKKNEDGKKRGTSRVDSEFLKDIEKWRLLLARNIALRNKELTVEELNLAVQLIIDRIVFFRMAEDRGIERYQTLYKLAESDNIYEQLCEVFKKADLKYNSGLFHFHSTPDYSEFVDNITLHLNIDDGIFKEIFKNLYYPNSPYEFSVISPEILGSIYENFLGSQIRLTPSHQAKVELKPEVQKAGGVYYTPQYIADYIVDNTVGKIINGKTPKQISKIKIVDPACGSGSFLLRAFQKLLDYHLEHYIKLQKPPKDVYYIGKDGIPRLTIREKKRILTNNIFGVDIDVNAVEVTKLSLLLKVLEDENKDVLEQQQKLFQEKVLPNLSYNIKCGNSLVGTEILKEDLTMDEISKINPFDWEDEFKEIFDNGGFDAVIGNPPYVGEKGNKETFYPIKNTDWGKQFYKRKMDLFYFFFHRSLDLLKDGGIFGMITTSYFITADGGIKLRNDLKMRANLLNLINLNELTVFQNAKGQHDLITIFEKKSANGMIPNVNTIFVNRNEFSNKTLFNKIANGEDELSVYSKVSQEEIYDTNKNYIRIPKYDNSLLNNIFKKIIEGSQLLGDIKKVSQGVITGADRVTQRHLKNLSLKDMEKNEGVYILSKEELNSLNLNDDELQLIKPFFKNSDIFKYYTNESPDKFLVYVTRDLRINDYPNIKEHLYKYSKIIKARSQDRGEIKAALKLGKWWVIFASRNDTNFEDEKIVVPQRSPTNTFGYNTVKWYASADVYFITNKSENDGISLKYILALLNSKLYYCWLVNKGKTKGDLLELLYTPLTEVPIKIIDIGLQKPFIELSEKMLELNKQLQTTKTPKEIRLLEKQLEITADEINKLVYELYDLSDDEIAMVEEMS